MKGLRRVLNALFFMILLTLALGLMHSFMTTVKSPREGSVVAYRGGGSFINYRQLTVTNCNATAILNATNAAVENTLAAVAESLSLGAEIIHLNVHRTADDQLVAFHDWNLDCATDGSGAVSQKSYRELSQLDAGYGYTWDEGKTYPYRNKGLRISRLDEFLTRYPQQKYWLNLKDNDTRSFAVLRRFLTEKHPNFTPNTVIITSKKGAEWFHQNAISGLKVISIDSVKRCGLHYMLVGWSGLVPNTCANTILMIPPSKAKWFWGYPAKMAARFQQQNSEIYLWYEHQPVQPSDYNVHRDGIGVVTSDQHFFMNTL